MPKSALIQSVFPCKPKLHSAGIMDPGFQYRKKIKKSSTFLPDSSEKICYNLLVAALPGTCISAGILAAAKMLPHTIFPRITSLLDWHTGFCRNAVHQKGVLP